MGQRSHLLPLLYALLTASMVALGALQDPVGLLMLTEAAGVADGATLQSIVDAGPLCAGLHEGVVLLVGNSPMGVSIRLLKGPTPHSQPLAVVVNVSGTVLATAVQSGNLIILLSSDQLVMATPTPDCSGLAAAVTVLPLPPGPWTNLAAVQTADKEALLVLLSPQQPAFGLVHTRAGAPPVFVARTTLGLPLLKYQAVGAGDFGNPVGESLVVVASSTPGIANVYVAALMNRSAVNVSSTEYAASDFVGASISRPLGDIPMVTLVSNTTLCLLASNGTSALVHYGQVQVVGDRPLAGAAPVRWLVNKNTRAGEQQLLLLRAPPTKVLNFEVNVLVYARPIHFLVRRSALSNTRAQYNYAGNEMQPQQFLGSLAATHANTYSALVCDHPGNTASWGSYTTFISVIEAAAQSLPSLRLCVLAGVG